MIEAAMPRTEDMPLLSRSALHIAAVAWLVPTLIGQGFFAYHVAETYFATAISGNLAAWDKRLFVGLVPGDTIGNAALFVHLFIAFVITVSGALQLIPQIRTHAPAFHRWNGRTYIVIAVITSMAGIYMNWTRDTFGPDRLEVVVGVNGLLIIGFAVITLRYAVARDIPTHQRWALRTFMVVNGVFFLRVIYAFLRVFPGETPGLADDMSGPTNLVVAFASYLMPLAVLELYFLAQRSANPSAKLACAMLVLVMAGATSLGVYNASLRWMG